MDRLVNASGRVVVVGMHRSGTSALTRMINLLGLPLGDLQDLDSARTNPTFHQESHWESRRLIQENNHLLNMLGGSWLAPPSLSPGWENGIGPRMVVRRLERMFAGIYRTESWVWKDPRLCLTLPLWLKTWDTEPVIALVYRNPLDVARSLTARNVRHKKFDTSYGLVLWERYNRSALENVRGHAVVAIRFERLQAAPGLVAQEIAQSLGELGLTSIADPEVAARSITPDPRSGRSFVERSSATGRQDQLYEVLVGLEGSHRRFRPPQLAEEDRDVQSAFDSYGDGASHHRIGMTLRFARHAIRRKPFHDVGLDPEVPQENGSGSSV